jgi:hypothetical protein
MPSVSRERIAQVDDYGVVEDRHEDVDGTTIQFITVREDVDSTHGWLRPLRAPLGHRQAGSSALG